MAGTCCPRIPGFAKIKGMKERIEAALEAARHGHLIEAIEAIAGISTERADAARFAASRGNAEETVEHLTAMQAESSSPIAPDEPSLPASKRSSSFGR